jgi:hypothetical protein
MNQLKGELDEENVTVAARVNRKVFMAWFYRLSNLTLLSMVLFDVKTQPQPQVIVSPKDVAAQIFTDTKLREQMVRDIVASPDFKGVLKQVTVEAWQQIEAEEKLKEVPLYRPQNRRHNRRSPGPILNQYRKGDQIVIGEPDLQAFRASLILLPPMEIP